MFVSLLAGLLALTPYSEDFSVASSTNGWSKIQGTPNTLLQWNPSGYLVMDIQDDIPGNESIGYILDGVLQGTETVEASVGLVNTHDNYYKMRVQLWNVTDDVLLAESEEILVYGASDSRYVPVTVHVSYTAAEGDTGTRVQIRLKEACDDPQRNLVIDSVSAALLTSLPEGAYPSRNFVKNPGFDALYRETGGGQIPIYWKKAYGSDTQIQTSTSELKEGYRSLLLEDTGSGSVGAASDLMEVSPGFNYTAGADVKCVDTPSTGCIYLRFYDAAENMISSTSASSLASDWTSLSITEMAPTNATHVELLCYASLGPETGQVYFDNASLVYADEMLANGSWAGCPTNTLPVNWIQQNAAYPASTEEYDSEKVLCIEDASNVEAKGAYIILPATPGVPYKLASDARILTSGDDGATLQMRFLDASRTLIDCPRVQISSTQWQPYEVSAVAPADTVFIQLLLSSASTHTGTTLFKNVRLRENYSLYYVSPDGSGDGLSYTNPALYTSETLWPEINHAAENHPVKVVFRTGNYNNSNFELGTIGTLRNTIVLEGERPFGTLFGGLYGIRLYGSRNLVLRNIHFNSGVAQTSKLVIGKVGSETRNITVSDCYFVNTTNITYGACSMSGTNTYDITASDCAFIRVGKPNDGSHMVYNSSDSHNINLVDNYFEDGWGTYVKIRSGSSGYRISGNTFIQNNGYRTESSKPFVHFSAINSGTTDEVLGTDYSIENNVFEYNAYPQLPIWIRVSGETPINHPGYHEITLAEKDTIEGTGYAATNRNAVIKENFGIDILKDWVIGGNSYSNTSSVKIRMDRSDPPPGFQGISADLGALIND